jgi:mitochondrial fission protein ELM1
LSESKKTCWILTESGLAGTENQCLGLAEALGLTPVLKRFKLKSPWKELSPWLRFGHQYALAAESDEIKAPYPDLLLASGRKSIGLALHIKKQSGGKTFLVQIQDPRIDPRNFDLVVVPQHDPARGKNVLVTKGAMHRITPEKLAAEKNKFAQMIDPLPHPRVAVLIGGTSAAHQMTAESTQKLTDMLLGLNAGLMVTASRRTGIDNARLLRDRLKGANIYFWEGEGENPYFTFLANADYIIVTEDSVSMTSEALSTGKPVFTASLEGGARRLDRFHQMLQEQGYTRPFTGRLETWSYQPLRDTLEVSGKIREKLGF